MTKLHTITTILSLFIAALLTGCGAKMHSFTIDAPPQYSSEYIFKKMDIHPFKSNRKQYGNTLKTLLSSGVAKEGYIKVGKKGADATLTGTLSIGKISKNSRTERYECTKYKNKKKYETTCSTYYHTKKVLIKVDYALRSSKDGTVVLSESISEDFDKTWSSGKNTSAAKTNALTDDQILNNAIKAIADKIIPAITPHKETVSRELQTGDDDNIELGITYLTHGRVDQAIAIWDQCANKSQSRNDKAAAYYNIAVIKESLGAYRDAFELYSKANTLLPAEELYIEAMTRAESLKRIHGKLQNWVK